MSLLASVLNTSPSSWRSHFDAALAPYFSLLLYCNTLVFLACLVAVLWL